MDIDSNSLTLVPHPFGELNGQRSHPANAPNKLPSSRQPRPSSLILHSVPGPASTPKSTLLSSSCVHPS
ncbi:hypothetical protein PCANC_04043 [Puccinia coronata f. sp. avenae]|uniref:Uncharacterized protein n=1 Tax=Puccinia coronata f. sp. avenae TaxID=200324 RepID=A0A2N5V4A4_9BASI|nr:hypothetical protein PCASD_07150 [Puccinia coronata f. sp. avenae]PLW56328.1 hypothetical protein PCANC_04043 [Puccinia coronata f. sp. avenae]